MKTDLAATQHWLQEFITTPNLSGPLLAQASELVTSLERANIYRDMYLSRMGDALAVDFPGVLHHLGQPAFDKLVSQYVEAHPSRSYTLNRLSDHLPDFIAPGFVADLARLELLIAQVFDEAESPVLTAEAIAAVPADAWETVRLKPIAAFRLAAFRYPVSAYLGAVAGENPFPPVRKRQTCVVVYRRDYRVHRLDLPRPAFHLLTALTEGATLGAAIEQTLSRHRVGLKRLSAWFQQWASEGMFQSCT